MKKLLDRIKGQRDAWISKSTQDYPEQDREPPVTIEMSPDRGEYFFDFLSALTWESGGVVAGVLDSCAGGLGSILG